MASFICKYCGKENGGPSEYLLNIIEKYVGENPYQTQNRDRACNV